MFLSQNRKILLKKVELPSCNNSMEGELIAFSDKQQTAAAAEKLLSTVSLSCSNNNKAATVPTPKRIQSTGRERARGSFFTQSLLAVGPSVAVLFVLLYNRGD
jgi:hypothetical protein